MVRPVLLAVDDEPAARGSIEKELRKRYGADHEVICEGSGAAALGALERVGATTDTYDVTVVGAGPAGWPWP
jgi:threonine dehydratase